MIGLKALTLSPIKIDRVGKLIDKVDALARKGNKIYRFCFVFFFNYGKCALVILFFLRVASFLS